MNTVFRTPTAVLSVALGVGLGVLALPAQAAGRCDRPTVGGEARACAASREGIEALRRFVHRTRMIYGFTMLDFLPGEPNVPSAGPVEDPVGKTEVGTASVAPPRVLR